MANYTYSISIDTANGICNVRSLQSEVLAASLATQLASVTASGDSLTIVFNASLSAGDEASLDAVVAAHTGAASLDDPQLVEVTKQLERPPFSAKTDPATGKKLYKRDTGKSFSVSAGSNNCDYVITFDQMKITGVEIIGAEIGDYCDFEVYDTPTGTISTIPNAKLNQFGYSVNITKDFYKRECQYDADVIKDMKIRIVFNSVTAKTIYVNYIIHEVV